MSKINGTNLILLSDDGNGSGPVEIGFSQDCKLTVDMGTANATTKDSAGWDEIIPTNGKWSMDTNGLIDFHPSAGNRNIDDLFDDMVNKTPVTLYFQLKTPTTNDSSWWGVAYITKLEQNAKDKDLVSYSATFEGTGKLTRTEHA